MIYQASMQAALDSIQFSAPSVLVVGKSYNVSYLIDQMIDNSDNGAMNILIDNMGYPYLSQIYSSLGFKGPTSTETDYKISASDYSLFFRVLYNATYLNDAMSEKALSILSKSTFDSGITALLPEGTIVAHKFGEHVYDDSNPNTPDALELHDCGIVYAPNNPYFLCIMTHGSSLNTLQNRIQGISSLVYDAIKAQN
jgi:beta-lactamase class A